MDDLVRTAEQRLAAHPFLLSEFRQRAGVESYRAGQKERAEFLLQRAWEIRSAVAPEGVVLLYLSETALERGQTERARRYLESYSEYGGEDADRVLFRLAGLELAEQNWGRAAELFLEYRVTYPESERAGEAAYQQAFALYRAENLAEAEQVLSQVGSLPGGEVANADIRRLNASILRRQGRVAEAVESLELYLRERPEGIDARFEYVKLLFQLERYRDVVRQAELISADTEFIERLDTGAQFELRYLAGLAYTAERRYRDALSQLVGLAESVASTNNGESLRVMIPYARYYTGWARYRLSEYDEAIREFTLMIDEFPAHELAPRAGYLAGWSAYSLAEYTRAEDLLRSALPAASTNVQRAEILFLLGQALSADQQYTEAAVEFRTVTLDFPDSGLADHAQFEYAGVLKAEGRIEAAAAAYQVVYNQYPASGVAGQALYNRGELFFQAGRYEDARQAYLEYRRAFPEGALFDAALYWGGLASSRLGEPAGALLLWNQLINEYRDSAFRADAMIQTARLHESRRDYRSALNMLTQLLVAYPEQAVTAEARRRADELVLLIGGIGEREASLLVRIESGNRAATPAGREAILELGRSVFVEGLSGVNIGLIIPMLQETAAMTDEDAPAAAEALSLLGEQARRVGEYAAAAEYYLEAAAVDPGNADRTARSLFRAGEAYQRIGRRAEVEALLTQLQESFPNSSWTEQARRVLGGQ
ncbi:MAG: tetratricopeptide repeat protein [Spirochaeta sp.]|nr:tetratricopeptide repeat protein [Spirochaeta sp.]